MDAETGREPTTPSARPPPSIVPRRRSAVVALAIAGAAAIGFAAGFVPWERRGAATVTQPEPMARTEPTGTTSPSPIELKPVVDRFHGAKDEADRMARDIAVTRLAEDPLSDEAHFALGHAQFFAQVPEIVAFRDYPFIRTVEAANRLRWLGETELRLATAAWAKTLVHARRLDPDAGDPRYRALDQSRQAFPTRDRSFRDYVFEAIFASPYVLFRSGGSRVTPEELARIPSGQRSHKLAEMEAERARFHRALTEKGLILRQLYAEFMRRYAKDCDLTDLTASFGGRPDLPVGKRSYVDGYTMPVWTFSSPTAFLDHHEVVLGKPIDSSVAGYYDWRSGLVLSRDEPDDRAHDVEITVGMGTQQLVGAFQRQRREWGSPPAPVPFFDKGFADYMGAASLAPDRTVTFHGRSNLHLTYLRGRREELEKRRERLRLIPTKVLVSFEGYAAADAWLREKLSLDDRKLLRAQSWALVHFLNEGAQRRREPQFRRFLRDMLHAPARDLAPAYARTRFAERFDLGSDADWERFHAEFEVHFRELVRPDATPVPPTPALDDWPGFVTPRSLDPESTDVTAGEELVPPPE